jgi:hypothetical protein
VFLASDAAGHHRRNGAAPDIREEGGASMSVTDTRERNTQRLVTLENAWWKKLIGAQALYAESEEA